MKLGGVVSSEFRLRPYRIGDRASCLALFDGHVPKYFRPDERAGFATFLDALPGPFFVIENSSGETVACGGVALEPDRPAGSLCWGIVHEAYQRRGLGRVMALARMHTLAEMPGCESVRLETISTTAGFFETLGFSAVATVADGYGPGIDGVEMRLTFDGGVRERLRSWLETQEAVALT
jgi:ribosomal protein S18 acetylase RimI-like enzyme